MSNSLTLRVMNTEVFIQVEYLENIKWQLTIEQWFTYVAKEWSRFPSNNELHTINSLKIGETFEVLPPLYECLNLANNYFIKTNGLFSPYLKEQIEQHGYTKTFDSIQSTNEASTLTSPCVSPPFKFHGNNKLQRIAVGQIDLGGFAKGFAGQYAKALLQQLGETKYGIIDVGGDLLMWSNGEKQWHIGISDPIDDDKTLRSFAVKTAAIATSNRLKRSWNNGKKHHLLNGQTGDVQQTGLLQATVIGASLIECEVATKLCFYETPAVKKFFPNTKQYFVFENDHYWY